MMNNIMTKGINQKSFSNKIEGIIQYFLSFCESTKNAIITRIKSYENLESMKYND
jgi:hypothetical protein